MSDHTPNPGSREAGAQGCVCPVMDNHGGEGRSSVDGPVFWIVVGCPVHDKASADALKDVARRV